MKRKIPEKLFVKILSGDFSPEEVASYIELHPEHKSLVDELLTVSKELHQQQYSSISVDDALEKVKQKVRRLTPPPPRL